jgi:Ca2+-binding EF-hand superfamily protein
MKKIMIVTAFLLVGTNPAFAETQVVSSDFTFNSVDMNADGFISAEEAIVNEGLANQFSLLDVDQDGMLSESEFNEFTNTVN